MSEELLHLVVSIDEEIQPLQMVINQLNIAEGKLRPRTNAKSAREPLVHAKVKCDICHKFYRADYVKVRLAKNLDASHW